MEDAQKRGKEKQKESRSNETHLTSHQKLPPQMVPQPSSSSSTEPELIQDAKRLKLTYPDHQTQYTSPTDLSISAGQRTPVSSILPQPRPPQHFQQTQPILSTERALAAQLRLMTPKERAVFKGQPIAKKGAQQSRAGLFWTQPGPSPLRPGPTPYETVKKVVKRVMDYLNLSSTSPLDSSKNSSPEATANATKKPTIEMVVLMLDEYVEGISRSVSEEEMEGLLREFQRKVGVDDKEVSWYSLMKESNVAFWWSLADHFISATSSWSNRQSSDSKKSITRIRDPKPVPEPSRRRQLLLPHQFTYLRPRPAHRPPDPDPNTRMGPPKSKINCDMPHQMVKKALTFLKSELRLTKFPNPNYSLWKTLRKSSLSVEAVILMLDEYVDSIAKTSSSDEMKALLMLFQRRLGLPAWPSFYNLIWFSSMDFLDHLGDHFLYDSISDDDDDAIG